jgi:hypothetical protein
LPRLQHERARGAARAARCGAKVRPAFQSLHGKCG